MGSPRPGPRRSHYREVPPARGLDTDGDASNSSSGNGFGVDGPVDGPRRTEDPVGHGVPGGEARAVGHSPATRGVERPRPGLRHRIRDHRLELASDAEPRGGVRLDVGDVALVGQVQRGDDDVVEQRRGDDRLPAEHGAEPFADRDDGGAGEVAGPARVRQVEPSASVTAEPPGSVCGGVGSLQRVTGGEVSGREPVERD